MLKYCLMVITKLCLVSCDYHKMRPKLTMQSCAQGDWEEIHSNSVNKSKDVNSIPNYISNS